MDAPTESEIHLNWAAWSSLTTGLVSFTRDWTSKSLPDLWWGKDHLSLESLRRVSPEQFGFHGGYFGRRNQFLFVLPASLVEDLDLSGGLYVAGSFNGWEAAIGKDEWKLQAGRIRGRDCWFAEVPRSRLEDESFATFKFVTGQEHWLDVPEHTPNTHVDGLGIKNYLFSCHRSGRHLFRFRTPLTLNQSEGRKLYFRHGSRVESLRLNPGVFLKTLEAPGPLGATVGEDETVFRLFAPRARRVRLHLYPSTTEASADPFPLEFGDDHIWEVRVPGNRHGWFYHYTVEGQESDEAGYFDADFPILDPWARAVAGPLGPGIVVEASAFEREADPFTPPHWHDLVIAETHVRDLAAQAPLEMSGEERLGYRGLQKWVEDSAFYLSALGVNAVELQPVHEFDTENPKDYGWGYMPVNYFSPASQYASEPGSLSQIREFQNLVRAFHDRGMAVILDVVYNHVGEPNYLQYLDRDYYFLLTPDGHFENHSGCGNTLDAGTPVVRRLILDSLVHWMTAYGVDGFRFDLAELVGRETLAWLEPRLKEVNPGVILIAEPWSFRGHIGRELKETGFMSWNDEYRESLREYLTLRADAGRMWHLLQGFRDDWARFPSQSVNYVASHDDRCWIDKITENGSFDGTRPTATDRRRTHLMAALLMFSTGVPMLLAGTDMLHSKGGANNTYLRGDLNALPYRRMAEYSGSVAYFRRWIAFRLGRHGRLLRRDRWPEAGFYQVAIGEPALGVIANHGFGEGPERLLFVVNPGYEFVELAFPETDLAGFRQLADTERWGDPFLDSPTFTVAGERVTVPPVSCGLFLERA